MLPHETAARGFRALGWLAYLIALLLVVAFFTGDADLGGIHAAKLLIVLVPVGFGVLYWKIAAGLRRQQEWARNTAIVFALLMLLGIPVGTLVGLYLLYHLTKGFPARASAAPAPGRPVGGLRR